MAVALLKLGGRLAADHVAAWMLAVAG